MAHITEKSKWTDEVRSVIILFVIRKIIVFVKVPYLSEIQWTQTKVKKYKENVRWKLLPWAIWQRGF